MKAVSDPRAPVINATLGDDSVSHRIAKAVRETVCPLVICEVLHSFFILAFLVGSAFFLMYTFVFLFVCFFLNRECVED